MMPLLVTAIGADGLSHPRSPRPEQHSKEHAAVSPQTLRRSHGEWRALLSAAARLADLLNGWGESQREMRLLDEAFRLGRELGDRQTITRTLRYLGVALRRKGDLALSPGRRR